MSLPTRKEILNLEEGYRKQMKDWRKTDTLYTYFRRHGMHSMARAFEKDYKRLKLV